MLLSLVQPAWAGEELVIGVGRDFHDGPDSRAFVHGSTNAWEALTYLDGDLNPRPWLAEAWSRDEAAQVWTFRLRAGVRLHDGGELTAADVQASLARLRRHPKYDPAGVYQSVTDIQALGREVLFRLSRPEPAWPRLISYYQSPIVRAGSLEPDGRLKGLVASGPYRVEAVRAGQAVRLAAFDRHWAGRPHFRRVVFRQVPDPQVRLLALASGELSAVADVGAILPQQLPELKRLAGVITQVREVATTHYLLFNCRRAPWSDPAWRRWLAGALDRPALVAGLVGGAGVVAADPYAGLASDYAFGLLAPRPQDRPAPLERPERPMVILLNGATLGRWPYLELAQVIVHVLAQAGLPARIEIREAGASNQAVRAGEYDLTLLPHTLMTGEPDFFYRYFLHPQGSRWVGWARPEAAGLIEAARSQAEPVRRQALYRRLAGLVAEDLPLLPLYHDLALSAHRASLAGFGLDHFFRPDLLQVRPQEAQ